MVATSLVFGTVVSINGSRIVVSDQGAGSDMTRVIDAKDAQITEGLGAGATELALESIAEGDTVMVFDGNAS